MADPLRVGVIGTGGWGTHVAEQFAGNPDADVVALTDVAEANRAEAGETLAVNPAHQYAGYEAMFDAEALDAVQVTSPHELHFEHVTAALDRGCHVLCEKPFVPGVERAAEITRRIETSDRVVMVGYQRHVHPAYREIRDAVARGEIEPRVVTAEITQGWIEHVTGTWRVDPDLSGGGQLYDSGSHLLDAVIWLLGASPSQVSAEMAFFDDARRIDVQAALAVRFDDGTVANLTVSGDAPDVHERIAIRGGGGRAVLEGSGWDYRGATITDAAGDERLTAEGDLSTADKVDAFVDAALAGETPPATARDAFRATALTEAAYEAARTGERTPVAEDP